MVTKLEQALCAVLKWAILAYRLVSRRLPPRCRFYPSCSAYALDALETHRLGGLALIAGRLMRCHPFHPGGLDPVPPCNRSLS